MHIQPSHLIKKRRKWPYIVLGIVLIFVLFVGGAYYALRHIGIEGILSSRFLQNQITERVGEIEGDIFSLLPAALGFQEPQTYLVLFLNNTELRPGGGFIGVYATVRLDRGNVEVLAVEGTELLDNRSSKDAIPTPPTPLSTYLKVDGWYFRDSNWSPDFGESAKRSLELYRREAGIAADDIDAVIGITPTVLERLMERTGPLVVDGITFTPENVVEELEHEVEYNFYHRGIARADRKDIIESFMHIILDELKSDIFLHPTQYKTLAETLVKEKHIIAYALDSQVQDTLRAHFADGAVRETMGDYLMWVDANLGALKTDHAIDRTISYQIRPRVDGVGKKYYEATVTTEYAHTHNFDWRTSRYLTYARLYVPRGSVFVSGVSQVGDVRKDIGAIDRGNELGKEWYGTFISVEPLTTKKVSLVYMLPDSVTAQIDAGLYTLLVQKQLGLVGARLTLDLDFDTTIQSASPSELESDWGNDTYTIKMPFESDHTFEVTIGK